MTSKRLMLIGGGVGLLILALAVRWASVHLRFEVRPASNVEMDAMSPSQWAFGSAISVGLLAVLLLVAGGVLLFVLAAVVHLKAWLGPKPPS